ncbi:MAG TPA: hypothetical protein VLE03_03180 [Nitrospiraceae bacterium]|nr:hypothetical protein [Nitrospiraceae bacterium]
MGLAVCSGWNWTAAGEVGVGPHASAGYTRKFVNEVTGAAIHRHAIERSWINRRAERGRFHGIQYRIPRSVIIDIAAAIQERLECLSKASFDE